MKRLRTRFALLALLPLLAFELLSRSVFDRPFWYQEEIARRDPRPKVILVGSSRMRAAVDPLVVAERLKAKGWGDRAVYNMGRGGASPVMHWLGLRDWVKRDPGALRDGIVLIETFEGVPNQDRWSDAWVYDGPQLLPPLLRWEDIPKYLRNRESLGSKLGTLTSAVFQSGTTISRWREKLMAGVRPETPPPNFNRRLQPAFTDWDSTVLHDVAMFARDHGARVEFVSIPQGGTPGFRYRGASWQSEKESFAKAGASWGVEVRSVPFKCDESDFPDRSHLRQERSAEFSRALVEVLAGV